MKYTIYIYTYLGSAVGFAHSTILRKPSCAMRTTVPNLHSIYDTNVQVTSEKVTIHKREHPSRHP